MHPILEQATLTSKGQITIPKSIRQALGIAVGEKLSFEWNGSPLQRNFSGRVSVVGYPHGGSDQPQELAL